MGGTYRHTTVTRVADRTMAALARLGVSPAGITSLTVVGRTSGQPRTVPVTPIQVGGREYLVAPYGPVGWVNNLRAAGTATLRRGRRISRITVEELAPAEAAPVLQRYVQKIPLVRSHVDAAPDDPVSAFEAVASRHPVFAVTREGRPASGERS